MKDQFVDYETSRMLSELGFKEPCLQFYIKRHNNETEFALASELEWDIRDFSAWIDTNISAPLWQQIEAWLCSRNIFVQIELDQTSYPKFAAEIYEFKHISNFERITDAKNWFLYTTSEEARNYAIRYAVKYLYDNLKKEERQPK